MSRERLIRTEALLGADAMARLASSHVLLLGLGGVGGHTLDALVRSGVGSLTICDCDCFSESNINRQLLATSATVGRMKAEVALEHCRLLRDDVNITVHSERISAQGVGSLLESDRFDLVIDAVDDVSVKVAVAYECKTRGIPILTCLGTGNRLDPTAFRFTDIARTTGCPLARLVRLRLRDLGVKHLRVLVSDELPHIPKIEGIRLGSVAYVTSVAGLMLAAEAVKTLTAENGA